MKASEKREAAEKLARDRAVKGWAFCLPGESDELPGFIRAHWAVHQGAAGTCRPCDKVREFAAGLEEAEDIRVFLNGGPCPEKYRAAYQTAREQLKLGPKDWYEAFADAAIGIKANGWPTEPMTPELEKYCEDAADSIAERPECEK